MVLRIVFVITASTTSCQAKTRYTDVQLKWIKILGIIEILLLLCVHGIFIKIGKVQLQCC